MKNNIYPKVHVIVLNWNNKELGETGVLQELRFRYDKINVNVYSDIFRRLEKLTSINKKISVKKKLTFIEPIH